MVLGVRCTVWSVGAGFVHDLDERTGHHLSVAMSLRHHDARHREVPEVECERLRALRHAARSFAARPRRHAKVCSSTALRPSYGPRLMMFAVVLTYWSLAPTTLLPGGQDRPLALFF